MASKCNIRTGTMAGSESNPRDRSSQYATKVNGSDSDTAGEFHAKAGACAL